MCAFHSKTFRMYYICKDRVHYVAMPCSQFGYNNVYIISGVMKMVCCCAIFFPLFVYCICPEPTCNDLYYVYTKMYIHVHVHMYVL